MIVIRDADGASRPSFTWMMCCIEPSNLPATFSAMSIGALPRAAKDDASRYSTGEATFMFATARSASEAGGAAPAANEATTAAAATIR